MSSGRGYERLGIIPLGNQLLDSGDLDPVYWILHRATLPQDQLYRWLVAYWCLYSTGAACYISERRGQDFWAALHEAADNKAPSPVGGRWPRGHERRHFRGAAATEAVELLRARYGERPEGFVEFCCQPGRFVDLSARVREHKLFGPWMAFKVGDMTERVLGMQVDFSHSEVFFFTDPQAAALMLWRIENKLPPEARPKNPEQVVREVAQYVLQEFSGRLAPPSGDRPLTLQEVETILCKWKSHMNGAYPLMCDTDSIRQTLGEWQRSSPTAELLGNVANQGYTA